jgi:hypothetical protein
MTTTQTAKLRTLRARALKLMEAASRASDRAGLFSTPSNRMKADRAWEVYARANQAAQEYHRAVR